MKDLVRKQQSLSAVDPANTDQVLCWAIDAYVCHVLNRCEFARFSGQGPGLSQAEPVGLFVWQHYRREHDKRRCNIM